VAIGWRYLLGTLATSVTVGSLREGMEVAHQAVAVCAADDDDHRVIDLRPDRVELFLRDRTRNIVPGRDATLALISEAVGGSGRMTAGETSRPGRRPVQMLELAIDAMDVAAVRPFWKAVLAYGDEGGSAGPTGAMWTGPPRSRPSGSNRWMCHARNATGSTSI
jgi:4a-hydroxytetrahydrobiopterin dehydratase